MSRRRMIAALTLIGAVGFAAAATAQSSSIIPQQAEAPPVAGVAPSKSQLSGASQATAKQSAQPSGAVKKGVLTPEKK